MNIIDRLLSLQKYELPELSKTIGKKLMSIEILDIKETMRKAIHTDIIGVLVEIKLYQTNDEIENYITKALSSELLDKKTKSKLKGYCTQIINETKKPIAL